MLHLGAFRLVTLPIRPLAIGRAIRTAHASRAPTEALVRFAAVRARHITLWTSVVRAELQERGDQQAHRVSVGINRPARWAC